MFWGTIFGQDGSAVRTKNLSAFWTGPFVTHSHTCTVYTGKKGGLRSMPYTWQQTRSTLARVFPAGLVGIFIFGCVFQRQEQWEHVSCIPPIQSVGWHLWLQVLLGKFRLRWVLETRKKELKVLQVDHTISVQPQGRAFALMVFEEIRMIQSAFSLLTNDGSRSVESIHLCCDLWRHKWSEARSTFITTAARRTIRRTTFSANPGTWTVNTARRRWIKQNGFCGYDRNDVWWWTSGITESVALVAMIDDDEKVKWSIWCGCHRNNW